MRKKEQKLWDAFKGNSPPNVWLQRVENGAVAGMPDVLAKGRAGSSIWIELKAPERPMRPTTPVLGNDLRTDQINWHLKAASMGIVSYIMVRDSGGVLSFVPGKLAAEAVHWKNDDFKPYWVNWQKVWEIINEPQ